MKPTIPNPRSMLEARGDYETAREAMRSERYRYVGVLLPLFLKLPKDARKRRDWCFQAAQKAKDAGLYAKSTYLRDVAFSFVKRFYERSTPRIRDWRLESETWSKWRRDNFIDLEVWSVKRMRMEQTA